MDDITTSVILADLYIFIKEDKLDEVQTLINMYNNPDLKDDSSFYLTPADFNLLKHYNNSYLYLLDHYVPQSPEIKKTMWKHKIDLILASYRSDKIWNNETIYDFIITIMENPELQAYEIIDLIRLSIAIENKELIITLKEKAMLLKEDNK